LRLLVEVAEHVRVGQQDQLYGIGGKEQRMKDDGDCLGEMS